MDKNKQKNMQIFYGTVKVSDKGQIAIPVELRKDLDINKGDQFLIGRRKDGNGLTLLKLDVIEEIFNLPEEKF